MVAELRKILADKETEMAAKVEQEKVDAVANSKVSDAYIHELSAPFLKGFQNCYNQVVALYPGLDLSKVNLYAEPTSTSARTVEEEEEAVAGENFPVWGKATKGGQESHEAQDPSPKAEGARPSGAEVVKENVPADQP